MGGETSSNALRQFSLLYVPEEDRLFLEIEMGDGLRAFWITRRVARNLVGFLRKRLGEEATNDQEVGDQELAFKRQALSAFERDIAESRNPLKSGKIKQDFKALAAGDQRAGLLKTVRLQSEGEGGQRYLFQVQDTQGKGLAFRLSRLTLRSLENLLLKQIGKAQWE